MARIGRVLYDGAYYHIINRGHDRQALFKEEKDFIKFKEVIVAYLEKYDFRVFHYCFMSNHFHMLIQVMKGLELPHIMKGISLSYVNYYKRKYRKVGYIFQSRYKSLLIEKEEYLLECARYIERNPLRAKIVTDLSRYKWSPDLTELFLTCNLILQALLACPPSPEEGPIVRPIKVTYPYSSIWCPPPAINEGFPAAE